MLRRADFENDVRDRERGTGCQFQDQCRPDVFVSQSWKQRKMLCAFAIANAQLTIDSTNLAVWLCV